MSAPKSIPSVSVNYEQKGTSAKANELGMRPMQERAYQKRGKQYLLIKFPPASGKSRALMFVALGKLEKLLHKFFDAVRLDLQLKDRFGFEVEPREWFLVPLPIIEEAIQKLIDGTLASFHYEPEEGKIVEN